MSAGRPMNVQHPTSNSQRPRELRGDQRKPAPPGRANNRKLSSTRLLAEFIVLFLLLPIPFCFVEFIRPFLIPTLVAVALACFVSLRRDELFPREHLWNVRKAVASLGGICISFLVAGIALTAFVYFFDRDSFLLLPRKKPLLWVAIMFLYPLLSVYPQEVIYRAFLFHRYKSIFPTPAAGILISALVFGFVHIVFKHYMSVVLSLIAGAFFAITYARTKSLAAVWLQHALFGALIFTLGLGKYFFHGTVKVAELISERL